MICKNCGKEIEDNSKFCVYCGYEVDKEREEEYKELGIKKIKERRDLYKLLAFISLSIASFLFVLSIILLTNDDYEEMAGAIGCLCYLIPGVIVFFVNYLKHERYLKNEDKLIKIGKKMYEKKKGNE